MKKYFNYILYILILFNLFVLNISADDFETVKFHKCIDGDTASFLLDDEIIKVRFLAIDTPETVHPKKDINPIGVLASDYTCNKIKNAKEIKLEYDAGSDKKDKYNRTLAWIWVDDSLLQEELIEQGLGKVNYIYGDYKYTETLYEKEEIAKKNNLGMWKDPIVYTVEFYIDEKLLKSENVIENSIVDKFIPSKKGYKFISWKENNKDFDFNTRINDNVKLNASFEKQISIYEIIFYLIIIYILQKLGYKKIKWRK